MASLSIHNEGTAVKDNEIEGQSQEALQDELAGRTLIDLASKDSESGSRKLRAHELELIDKSFSTGAGSISFAKSHIQALCAALETRNLHVAEVLVQKASHGMFEDKPDILQLAILPWDRWYNSRAKGLHGVVNSLILLGAKVNNLDSQGNSPLFYACINGLSEIFELLVASGADCFTLHDALPVKDLEASPSNSDVTPPKVNLLRITSDARLNDEPGRSITSIWRENLDKSWGLIIMSLVDMGLESDSEEPSLVKLLHVACYQGNLACAEKLLQLGVSPVARAGRSDNRDDAYGSALHAALRGRQKDVTLMLLKLGVDPRKKRPCRVGLGGRNPQDLTPIQAAFEWSAMGTGVHLGVCESLIKAGVDEGDSKLVMSECVKKGEFAIARRLLQRGVRLSKLPPCDNLELVKVFEGTCEIDPGEHQKHAASKGLLEMLKYLVEKYGPKLPLDSFNYTALSIIRDGHLAILGYLIDDYGFSVNAIFPVGLKAQSHSNLLQRACILRKVDAVQFLLAKGADPACPGLSNTAIECLQEDESSIFSIERFANTILPVIRVLSDHSEKESQNHPGDWSLRVAQLRCSTQEEPARIKHQSEESPWQIVNDEGLEDPARIRLDGTSSGEAHSARVSDCESETREDHEDSNFDTSNGDRVSYVASEPNNSFAFETLDGSRSVRLVELQPCKLTGEPIQCRLLHCDLAEKPDYEAVAYEPRSSPSPRPCDIELNGKLFDMSRELWLLLQRLRKKSTPRLLWVNAISVNQNDNAERSRYVKMTKDVFENAKQVIVWTGEDADNSHLVFKHVADWDDDCRDYKNNRQNHLKHDCMDCGSGFGRDHVNPPKFSGPVWDAWRKFCQRPIFYRIWLLHEVGFAKKAIFMCGNHTATLEQLTRCSCFHMGGYNSLSGVDGPTHLQNLQSITRSVSWSHYVIEYSRVCQPSDPRDNAYALVAFLSQQEMPINYDLSVAEVFRKFTQAVIEEKHDLGILEWNGTRRHRSDLPSWVPDFTVSQPVGELPMIFGSYSRRIDLPRHTLPSIRFAGNDLIIEGKHLDRIDAISEELIANEAHAPGKKAFLRVLRRWEGLAVTARPKSSSKTITDIFCDTLVAHEYHLGYPREETQEFIFAANAPQFVVWYGRYGAQVLKKSYPKLFRDIELMLSWAGDKYDQKRRESDIGHYTRRLEQACYGRSFFTSADGSTGLAPPRARKGDSIVFLPGGQYPFVLRKRDDGAFEMIGDCYLYDLDTYDLMRDGRTKLEEFVIR